MNDLLEAIRLAVAEGATGEQKAGGAQACRTILIALETEAGKPLNVPGAPPPHPLAGIDPGQALDLLIARLRAAVPTDEKPRTPGVRFPLVAAPPGVPWKKKP
jgi:hypothetical protein